MADVMIRQVLNAVGRIESILRGTTEATAGKRAESMATSGQLDAAMEGEREKLKVDTFPAILRRQLESVVPIGVPLDYRDDLARGVARSWPGSAGPSEAEYHTLLQTTRANVQRVVDRASHWNEKSNLARLASKSDRPEPLSRGLADDISTLERWAHELSQARAAELQERETQAQQQIKQRLNDEIAATLAEQGQALNAARQVLDRVVAESGVTARGWDDPMWSAVMPPERPGADVRIGQFEIRAPVSAGPWDAPATLYFPFAAGVLVDGEPTARPAAVELVRSICARLLAAAPAGKVQFTFIDPIALGQSVADFQHLGDYDEQLVGVRPITNAREIEARLAALSEHIETVISKYLRGQFASIDEYNAVAGELAEPYRVLVVFDYPAGFGDHAAQLLLSLVENGSRCGLHTIVVTDPTREQPRDLTLDRLRLHQQHVQWFGSRARLRLLEPVGAVEHDIVPDVAPPILFDDTGAPLSAVASLLVTVGKQARQTGHRPVTLRRLMPALSRAITTGRDTALLQVSPDVAVDERDTSTWWRGSTEKSAIAPLGISGAQDVAAMYFSSTDIAGGAVMVGLPRSGKTSSLHSAILTMCLLYGPDELELYLIDAKHGVEFKVYEHLPHARMVSINSEREFSVAVLRSIDHEIQRRAELMKAQAAGRANISEYRKVTGEPMARIVLIMDEFHEIFEEDDRLGHEAFQAFSNIVRQGPFAGVHVVVASQTLSSMPALDRPTLQLLPQRVAFMCNESDADVVMGDTNRGTRLLTKQGEGLFNPARGEASQNKPFQGLFVPAQERDLVIQGLRAKASESGWQRVPRVFDGDATASRPEAQLLQGSSARVRIPLGEPFSLEPFGSILLRRTRGSNILLVGDLDDDMATDVVVRGALHSCITSCATAGAEVSVIDFIGDEELPAGLTVMELAKVTAAEYARSRGAPAILSRLADSVAARLAASDYSSPGQILVLFGLHRAHSLQPADPYSLEESPGGANTRLLTKILCDGPEVGVHVIVSCDGARSIERRLGDDLFPEFALRLAGSKATPADLSLVAGTYGDMPEVRRNQLLVSDQLKGTVSLLRGYPLLTAAEITRARAAADA